MLDLTRHKYRFDFDFVRNTLYACQVLDGVFCRMPFILPSRQPSERDPSVFDRSQYVTRYPNMPAKGTSNGLSDLRIGPQLPIDNMDLKLFSDGFYARNAMDGKFHSGLLRIVGNRAAQGDNSLMCPHDDIA